MKQQALLSPSSMLTATCRQKVLERHATSRISRASFDNLASGSDVSPSNPESCASTVRISDHLLNSVIFKVSTLSIFAQEFLFALLIALLG